MSSPLETAASTEQAQAHLYCPHCARECLIPMMLAAKGPWPIICPHCQLLFNSPKKQAIHSDDDNGGDDNYDAKKAQIAFFLNCPSCAVTLGLTKQEAMMITKQNIILSCPDCKTPLPAKMRALFPLGKTLFWVGFFYLLVVISFWVLLTEAGQTTLSEIAHSQNWAIDLLREWRHKAHQFIHTMIDTIFSFNLF